MKFLLIFVLIGLARFGSSIPDIFIQTYPLSNIEITKYLSKPHLVLGLISQLIKILLLTDLSLKKMPQLIELVEDSDVMIKHISF
ncbi:hypothetical protein YC2023_086308 [Brassica napus]